MSQNGTNPWIALQTPPPPKPKSAKAKPGLPKQQPKASEPKVSRPAPIAKSTDVTPPAPPPPRVPKVSARAPSVVAPATTEPKKRRGKQAGARATSGTEALPSAPSVATATVPAIPILPSPISAPAALPVPFVFAPPVNIPSPVGPSQTKDQKVVSSKKAKPTKAAAATSPTPIAVAKVNLDTGVIEVVPPPLAPPPGLPLAPVVREIDISSSPPSLPPPAQVVAQWADDYVIRVTPDLAKVCEVNFIPHQTRPMTINGPNPHGLLAVYRVQAEVWAIAHLVTKGHRSIDAWYGSSREDSIIRNLNSAFVRAGYPSNYITLNHVSGHIVSLDMGRRPLTEVPARGTCALFLDVYMLGTAEQPEEITTAWMSSLGYSDSLWVAHPFPGYYGCLATAAWIRLPDGKISWSPDKINQLYPAHYPCDDMHSSGANGIASWRIVKTWHTLAASVPVYNVVCFSPSVLVETPVVTVCPSQAKLALTIPDYRFSEPVPGFFADTYRKLLVHAFDTAPNWTTHLLPKKEVLVDIQHYHTVKSFLASRAPQSFTYLSLVTKVTDICEADPVWVAVRSRFPGFFLHYSEDLALAAFITDAETRARTLEHTRSTYAVTFKSINDSIKNINKPMEGSVSTLSGLAEVALVGAFAACAVGFKILTNRRSRLLVKMPTAAVGSEADVKNLIDTAKTGLAKAPALLVKATQSLFSILSDVTTSITNTFTATVAPGDSAINVEEITESLVNQVAFWGGVIGNASYIVLLAPWIEEKIKHSFTTPQSKLLVSLVIASLDLVGRPDTSKWMFAYQTCLHFTLAMMPVQQAIRRHRQYNAVAYIINASEMLIRYRQLPSLSALTGVEELASALGVVSLATAVVSYCRSETSSTSPAPDTESTWLAFRDAAHLAPDFVMPTNDRPALLESFSDEQSFFPCTEIRDYPLPEFSQDTTMTVNMVIDPVGPASETDGYFRWMSNPLQMERPMQTSNNLVKMVAFRLVRAVPPAPFDQWLLAAVLTIRAICEGLAIKGHTDAPDATCYRHHHNFGHFLRSLQATVAELLEAYPPPKYSKKTLAPPANRTTDQWIINIVEELAEGVLFGVPGAPQAGFPYWALQLTTTSSDFQNSLTYTYNVLEMTKDVWLAWLKHTDPSKRKRYIAAYDQVKRNALTITSREVSNVQVNQKRDEVLVKQAIYTTAGELEEKGFVSRPIHSVDPKVAVTCGPSVHYVTELFKAEMFCKPVAKIHGVTITFTMGAGLTDYKLSEWFHYCSQQVGAHIIVAGDDMLVFIHTEPFCQHVYPNTSWPRFVFVEGDLSQCDHTSRIGSLFNEYTILRRFGVPLSVIQLLLRNSRATLTAGLRSRPGDRIVVHRQYERNTGGVDTTIGNSLTSFTAALMTLTEFYTRNDTFGVCECGLNYRGITNDFQPDKVWPTLQLTLTEFFTQAYSNLGLVLKVRVLRADTVLEVGLRDRFPTFLKGMWYPTPGTQFVRTWGPLPSRLIKLGKTLRDPRELYPGLTYRDAMTQFANAITYSMRGFVWPRPIKQWLFSFVPPNAPVTDAWRQRTFAGEFFTLREAGSFEHLSADDQIIEELSYFYNVSSDVIIDFFTILEQVKPFTHFEHPFWWALAQDYA